MSLLLMGCGKGKAAPPFVAVNAETTAWRARLGTAVSDDWAQAVDAAFTSLKSGPISGTDLTAILDVLVIPGHAANNWINVLSSSFNPGAGGGAPSFSSGGYTFDGVDDYINTNFNPVTAAGHFALNTACFAIWTFGANTVYTIGFAGRYDATDGVSIFPRVGGDQISLRVNQTATLVVGSGITTSLGLTHVNRSASNAVQVSRNGVEAGTGSNASAALNSLNFVLGSHNTTTFAPGSIEAYYIGSSMTDNQRLDMFNILNTLRSAPGHP